VSRIFYYSEYAGTGGVMLCSLFTEFDNGTNPIRKLTSRIENMARGTIQAFRKDSRGEWIHRVIQNTI